DVDDVSSVSSPRLELVAAVPLFVERGDLERARALLALIPEGANTGDVQTRGMVLLMQARLLRAEGRPADALAAAKKAVATRREVGLPRVKEALVEALEAAFELGDLAEAEELLGFVEALPPGELLPFISANGARFSARLAAAQSQAERAEPGFTAAAAAFDGLSMPFHAAVVRLEHGEWLIGEGRPVEAETLLAEAREAFERVGARPS